MRAHESHKTPPPTRTFTGPTPGATRKAMTRRASGTKASRTNGAMTRRASMPHAKPRIPRHPNHRLGKRRPLVAIMLIAASVALGMAMSNRMDPNTSPGIVREESARSTPRSQWQKGEVPCLYQIDPQWDREPYAGGTIRENGCGPTALSMAYIALTGDTSLDPVAMARFSEQNGHTSGSLTAWTLMTEGAADLGLSSTELTAQAGAVTAELNAGHPIICSVGPGDFTTSGHFIVLAGLTDDGRVVVRDPNSATRSEQAWDLECVLGQCVNLWAFSAM